MPACLSHAATSVTEKDIICRLPVHEENVVCAAQELRCSGHNRRQRNDFTGQHDSTPTVST